MKPVEHSGKHKSQTTRTGEEKTARKIATMLARGNVLMQSGQFETEQDVEARRKALSGYEF
jgi:polyhydroxyalkanoate synthesis regulator phasin